MSNTHAQSRKIIGFLIRLSLITLLLGSCSRSQQLGVQDDPQEILNNKLRDPGAVLTPNQSITLLNHCAELGEQNAATAVEKTVSIFVGNTGAGRSTTLNALLGCQMKAVKPRELGLPGLKKIVIVDPESPLGEIMPIGHGWQSQTFMPQIVPTPDEPNNAYCDCPGFYDTRGAEINIANAINIRKVLQQATGVKAVFLTEYSDLIGSRGNNMRAMESMCHQMFDGADNLRKYQNSVLLGITKAPMYVDDEPRTRKVVRELLIASCDSPIAQILANRVFLFDPLDRATDNPDFWSLAQCRKEIMRLPSIPQRSAITLFQTTLTDGDKMHLLNTVHQLRPKIVNAITQGDVMALGQYWQLLQRLQIHPEIEQLIEGAIVPSINNSLLKQVDLVQSSSNAFNFYDAQQRLDKLTSIVRQLPDAPLVCNIDEIRRHISACEANQPPQAILDHKFHNPEAILTPDQSITLLNHCTELGEQNEASATEKTVSIFVGNTGAGKSTTLNALLGCQMKAVKPRELGLPGLKKIVIVDPESPLGEVMPIGHGRQSQTFLPQIIPTPDESNSAYCDCPGFSDTRGAEINIANAINIKKVLQQATGVKAIFLTSYNGLSEDRGAGVKAMESMCHQMFGSADYLRAYQSSVLLGITKAPMYVGGEPLTQSTVRELLTDCDSPIAQILADRIFLFDPLDRATDNPDFWSLVRCRNEIDQLDSMPQYEATTLFQTVLTDSDRNHLLKTIRQLRPKIVNAITQGDVTALGQHWQLLQRLRVMEHPEVEQLVEGQVLPAIDVALRQFGDIGTWTNTHNFDQAEAHIALLTQLIQELPGAILDINPDELCQQLARCRGQYEEYKRRNEEIQRLREKKKAIASKIKNKERKGECSIL